MNHLLQETIILNNYNKLINGNDFSEYPFWLNEVKKKSTQDFLNTGFPNEKGNEEWKYSNVKDLTNYVSNSITSNNVSIDERNINLDKFVIKDTNKIVFVNGIYSDNLTSILSDQAVFSRFLNINEHKNEQILQQYFEIELNDNTELKSLNTASFKDGAILIFPKGYKSKRPFQIIFYSDDRSRNINLNNRIFVFADEDSEFELYEHHIQTNEAKNFSNTITEIILSQNALGRYVKLNNQNEDSFNISQGYIMQKEKSMFEAATFDFGGQFVRNGLEIILSEVESETVIDNLVLSNKLQNIINRVAIIHQAPYTSSSQKYKGIISGKGKSVFDGKITVAHNANGVNSVQEDKNMLLSSSSEAYAKPSFWIYCDDVKCSHGATCGKIDEELLFYLRSRGFDKETAEKILVNAFADEVILSIKNDYLKSYITKHVSSGIKSCLLEKD